MLNAIRTGNLPPGLESWPDDSFPVEFDQADLPEEERSALDRVRSQFLELRSNFLSGPPIATSSTNSMQQVGFSASAHVGDSDSD